jgi:hypothetical protein
MAAQLLGVAHRLMGSAYCSKRGGVMSKLLVDVDRYLASAILMR